MPEYPELARCVKENEFQQWCWRFIARYAKEAEEFHDYGELEGYLKGLGLPKELISKVVKVVDVKKRIYCGVAVFVEPKIIIVGEGSQCFGSGYYRHKTIYFGDVTPRLIDEIEYSSDFVNGYYRVVEVVSVARPTIVYHTAFDYVGESKRFFNNELYVWP